MGAAESKVPEGSTPQANSSKTSLQEPSANANPARNGGCLYVGASEKYWGKLLTPTTKTPSAIFSRLINAIFTHFDATSTGTSLQPHEFCALLTSAGYTPEEFPPLQVTVDASPADLHSLDSWLANWMRNFPLDHTMTTRTFPPPLPIEPVNGRIRNRDQFLHALMYPEPPIVPDGQPLLTLLGLEQWFTYPLLYDPDELYIRLNHLLGALPRLIDPETGRIFEAQTIPRACFPEGPDPGALERKRQMEMQRMQAEHDALMAIQLEAERRQTLQEDMDYQAARMQVMHTVNMGYSQALRNAGGGWWVDDDGVRRYHQGYIR